MLQPKIGNEEKMKKTRKQYKKTAETRRQRLLRSKKPNRYLVRKLMRDCKMSKAEFAIIGQLFTNAITRQYQLCGLKQ